jgi:23S rRNA (pseudouridine1915-N3)-methyltransferase
MQIRILAVGTKMPAWVTAACIDYGKRLPRNWLKIIEIPLSARHKIRSVDAAITSEGEQLLSAINERDKVIALEVKGAYWSTQELTEQLASWQMQGNNISLLIGGPNGLSSECLVRAQQLWSLSPLTLPHPLVRIVLVEQLYRAWSILQNHPYHK